MLIGKIVLQITVLIHFLVCLFIKSVCPGNVISNGTSGSLSSLFYPANYPNDMECLWNITGPVGSRLILIFHRICFGICTNAMQPCGCDSLSINNVLKPRQLCLGSEVTPFISLENRISLSMVTDEQHTSKGFLAEYQSIFGPAGGQWLVNCYQPLQSWRRLSRCEDWPGGRLAHSAITPEREDVAILSCNCPSYPLHFFLKRYPNVNKKVEAWTLFLLLFILCLQFCPVA